MRRVTCSCVTTCPMILRIERRCTRCDVCRRSVRSGTVKSQRFTRGTSYYVRSIVRRSANLPSPEQSAFEDIATRLNFSSGGELSDRLNHHLTEIRAAYDRILGV